MSRIARITVPGLPHHVTQRGNRRQPTFFEDWDYQFYLDLLVEWCGRCHVEILAYCLMTNHVHLMLVPQTEEGLRKAISETHYRYSRMINFRMGWPGHLWQGRFSSFPVDVPHILAVARYIELNPVRAGICSAPGEEYPWSSARGHITALSDKVVNVLPLLGHVANWRDWLISGVDETVAKTVRHHEKTGRPLGGMNFLKDLEKRLGRCLIPKKPGPKPKMPETTKSGG